MIEEKSIWNESLSVGIELFDNHHKELLSIVIQLKHAIDHDEKKVKIMEVLRKLLSYSKYHFKAEERTMGTFVYAEIIEHQKEHTLFIKHIEDLIDQYSKNKHEDLVSLYEFLKEWWMYHILNVDKKYSAHLKKRI